MSRTESVDPPELLLPSRAHRPVLVLPEDPSDDELLRHWTLSEADTREILRQTPPRHPGSSALLVMCPWLAPRGKVPG